MNIQFFIYLVHMSLPLITCRLYSGLLVVVVFLQWVSGRSLLWKGPVCCTHPRTTRGQHKTSSVRMVVGFGGIQSTGKCKPSQVRSFRHISQRQKRKKKREDFSTLMGSTCRFSLRRLYANEEIELQPGTQGETDPVLPPNHWVRILSSMSQGMIHN